MKKVILFASALVLVTSLSLKAQEPKKEKTEAEKKEHKEHKEAEKKEHKEHKEGEKKAKEEKKAEQPK